MKTSLAARIYSHRCRGPLFALAALLLVIAQLSNTPFRSRAAESTAQKPLSSLSVKLERGRFTWQATAFETLPKAVAPMPFHRGFIVALDGMVALSNADRGGFKRIKPEGALPVDEGQRFLPESLAAGPTPLVVLELVDQEHADDAEARTFRVNGGNYTLALWRIPLDDGEAKPLNEALQALNAPALLFVRSGEIELNESESSALAEGDIAIVDRKTLLGGPTRGATIVLLATIQRIDSPAAAVTPATAGNRAGTIDGRRSGLHRWWRERASLPDTDRSAG